MTRAERVDRARAAGALRLAWLLAALALLCPRGLAEAPRPEVLYFYENYCGSCHPEAEFPEMFRHLTGESLSGYRFQGCNVANAGEKALFLQTADRLGVPESERLLPFVAVGDRWYAGTTQIQQALPRDFVAGDDAGSVLYYLYVAACGDCARARAVLDALPEAVAVTRGAYTFRSPVRVIAVDIGGDLGLAQALFEKYGVPEGGRAAPIVFLRDTYLSGAESIRRSLMFRLERGEAVGTRLVGGAAPDLSALSVLGALGAGLVGGLNPCALGMLLFFLTVVLSAKRRVGALAAVYLAGKLAAYLVIGTLLYGLFRRWNPMWLPRALRWGMTALGAALIALNVWDALAARRQDQGRIRNQLPQGARRFLHDAVRRMMSRQSRWLWAWAAAAAVLVASVEFLCAGQVYLATVLAAVEADVRPAYARLLLLAYCVAFLLPSAVLAFAAARGKALTAAAGWVNGHLEATKWLTAALFAAVLAIVWL